MPPKGVKRGPYRKAVRGTSDSTKKRLDRNLRLAAAAVGGSGEWKVTVKTATKIVVERVERSTADVRREQFVQCDHARWGLVSVAGWGGRGANAGWGLLFVASGGCAV